MTGFIYNNNSYNVGYGSNEIEYANNGDNTLGYSMYGENIPYNDIYTALSWINIPAELSISPYVQTDYYWDTTNCLDVRCCPVVPDNSTVTNFIEWEKPYPYDGYCSHFGIYWEKGGSQKGNNYLFFTIMKPDNSSKYYSMYLRNTKTLTPNTWYNLGICKDYFYVDSTENKGYIDTYGYLDIINPKPAKTLQGLRGKFSYFNVYEDATKANLIHSYKPYLYQGNIIIKDDVTGKIFEISNMSDKITYEIAQN